MLRRLLSRNPPVSEITPQEALRRHQAGAVIVDVREPDEWQAGHIPGALHIPVAMIPARLGELDPGRETIVVCRSGSRSAHAAAYLQQAGFTRVYNLSGGLIAWARERLPLV
jgi:rhodanese-related sulfurtransferase